MHAWGKIDTEVLCIFNVYNFYILNLPYICMVHATLKYHFISVTVQIIKSALYGWFNSIFQRFFFQALQCFLLVGPLLKDQVVCHLNDQVIKVLQTGNLPALLII